MKAKSVISLDYRFWSETANLFIIFIYKHSLIIPVWRLRFIWRQLYGVGNGVERSVAVPGMGRRPLIGTALLEDSHLSIDFCQGGTVLVDDIL